MIKAMTSRGMFPSQANEVIEKYIALRKDESMLSRWNDEVSAYPEPLQSILWMGVKDYAAKWIEENAPEAWFRPMFQYSDVELTQMMKVRDKA
jgi:hypothetical protein